jgi:hypothetical protein
MISTSSTLATGSRTVHPSRLPARLAAALIVFSGLAPGAPPPSPPSLDELLDRVGKQVEDFWNYFQAVTCTESAVQAKLDDKGKVIAERRSVADYLMLLQMEGGSLAVEESRIEKGHKEKHSGASLLTSNGFSLMALVFHPHFQASYRFRELTPESSGGAEMRRIEFEHIKGSPTPSVLLLKEREYPLEWSGVAWVVRDTGQVARVEARLSSAMEDVGLVRLSAAVRYTPVGFRGDVRSFWLPQTATVEAETRRQHWRNVHTFADYRRFNVDTQVRTGGSN